MRKTGFLQEKRQVIPRWHLYSMAQRLQLIEPINNSTQQHSNKDFVDKEQLWKDNKTLTHACDLVGTSIVLKKFDNILAKKASQYIIKYYPKSYGLALESANFFLKNKNNKFDNIPTRDAIRKKISSIKKRVRNYCINPILWMDLAFFYAQLGQNDSAKKCVTIALSINKENRYLLRSASRFFLHIKDHQSALKCIRNSEASPYDPWLVSAELAIANSINKTPKFIKQAKDFINNNYPSFHISELSCALGTIELENGAIKKSKKLFREALYEPTENALAQVVFIKNSKSLSIPINIHIINKQIYNFESKASSFFEKGEYKKSLTEIEQWLQYQPFSAEPAIRGSYIASVALGNFKKAINIIEKGKQASPNDFILNNNHIFSLASLGDTSEAQKILSQLNISGLNEFDKNVLKATEAVINFRNQKISEARKLYVEATTFFKNQKNEHSEAIAKLFWAREENIIKSSEAQKLKKEVLDISKKFPELSFATDKILGRK